MASPNTTCEPDIETKRIDSLDAVTSKTFATAVVHLAARVHARRDAATNPLAAFRATNVDGTLRTADAAVRAGAKRFVFVSSIKALAELDSGRPLKETDERAHPFGLSKAEAEIKYWNSGPVPAWEL